MSNIVQVQVLSRAPTFKKLQMPAVFKLAKFTFKLAGDKIVDLGNLLPGQDTLQPSKPVVVFVPLLSARAIRCANWVREAAVGKYG